MSLLERVMRRARAARHPNVLVGPAPEGALTDWNVPVRVRDGTKLRVNVFRPASNQPCPVILSAHPYDKDQIPARTGRVNPQYRVFLQPAPVRLSAWTSWEAPDPAVWVPRGYAVVNADLRGGGTSEGTGELFSDQEAEDYYDLIEWAGTQPWSNGRVGLDGVSYLAISQYKVAALRPPHLAAICPWEGLSDLYRDFARPGGVREDGFRIAWSKLTAHAARMRGSIHEEVHRRTERDAWYQAITPQLERIQVPVLVCGSFSDHSLHSRGSFEVWRRAGAAERFLYTHRGGKWCEYYGSDATETRVRFFDRYLKQQDNGWERRPPVRLAVYEEGSLPVAVTQEAGFPPPDLTWTKLRLSPGKLDSGGAEPHATEAFALPDGSVAFDWLIPHDMDIIGPMALQLPLELRDTVDAHLFAGVRKLRNGREVLFEGSFGFASDMVTRGWQRAAHRELDQSLSTEILPVHRHDRPEPLRPGEVVPVHIALLPHATRFRKGERLRLELRGKWHYPRNPFYGQFPTGYQSSPPGTCVLHLNDEAHLLLGWRPVPA